MAAGVQPVTKRPAIKRKVWNALESHYKKVSKLHLRQLFADDPERGERLAVEAIGLYLDYSKNRITDETLKLLLQLAERSGLQTRIEAMFRGEKINVTESRAVLHVALRAPRGASMVIDGKDVVPKVHSRGSFELKIFGWEGALTAEQTAEIAAAKQVIYDGFVDIFE